MALNTFIFLWLFQFNSPSFQMNTEILTNPIIHEQPAVGKVQARRGTKAASQSRLRTNCRHIMPYCQGQQLTAGDRAPDVGAIWFPVATGFSGMEGEVVCSAPPQPAQWCLLTSGAFGSSENFLSLERSSAVYSFALSVPRKWESF